MGVNDRASRCSRCSIDWPRIPKYDICPGCGEETDGCRGVTAIPQDEARSMANHFAFDHFYEDWDERRSVPLTTEGIDPGPWTIKLPTGTEVGRGRAPSSAPRPGGGTGTAVARISSSEKPE